MKCSTTAQQHIRIHNNYTLVTISGFKSKYYTCNLVLLTLLPIYLLLTQDQTRNKYVSIALVKPQRSLMYFETPEHVGFPCHFRAPASQVVPGGLIMKRTQQHHQQQQQQQRRSIRVISSLVY